MTIATKKTGKLRVSRSMEGDVRIHGGKIALQSLCRMAMIDCEPVREGRWMPKHYVAVTEIELQMVLQFLVEQVPSVLTAKRG
jgi:hypothetical protein